MVLVPVLAQELVREHNVGVDVNPKDVVEVEYNDTRSKDHKNMYNLL